MALEELDRESRKRELVSKENERLKCELRLLKRANVRRIEDNFVSERLLTPTVISHKHGLSKDLSTENSTPRVCNKLEEKRLPDGVIIGEYVMK